MIVGALPDDAIAALFDSGEIVREGGLDRSKVQPCSLDLTLSEEAWRLPASVLPMAGETVRDLVRTFARRTIDLSEPETLDRGKVYLVRLRERFSLRNGLGAYTNNKSSIGRIDLQTRTLTDHNPRSFDVTLVAGLSLNQAIFYGQRRVLGTTEIEELASREPLVLEASGQPVRHPWIDDGILLSVDLEQDPVGFVACHTTEELSLVPGETNAKDEFFEPMSRPRDGRVVLKRGHFYILSTRERLRVPPAYAVEMLPYETSAGEFRAHYAGFFDPGFGWSPDGAGRGTPAVLEARPYDDDIILRHGQPICKMAFEHLVAPPRLPYGAHGAGSHYQDQRGPRLSRFFT